MTSTNVTTSTVTTSSISTKNKFKRSKNQGIVLFWAPECKYEVILNNVKLLHRNDEKLNEESSSSYNSSSNPLIIPLPKWELVEDEKYESKVNLYWIDVASIHERFRTIQPWQIINHFPGMPNLARKNRMGQNLNKMLKLFPKEYAFYPKTWVLPGEITDFRQQFDNQGNSLNNKIFIIKPDAGCQGRGIFLTKTFENVPQNENVVAQVYIKKPLLLDGYKFDLRLYCLVTSVKPLRIYLFQDGLVRMCTEEYEKPTKQNIAMACMHLTNYAVNKHNSNFQQPSAKNTEENQDDASKRSLKWFMNYVTEQHGESKAAWLWRRMGTLCVRSIMSVMPTLSREYDQHFKSFTGVPVMVPDYSLSNLNTNNDSIKEKDSHYTSTSSTSTTSRTRPGSRRSSTQRTNSNSEEDEEDGDDNCNNNNSSSNRRNHNHPTIHIDSNVNEGNSENNHHFSSSSNNDNSKGKIPENYPSMRGSRCFEVLGFDVMIDCNLKPWIIEVNHLPSFGTDSPLDLDIKDRLMKQVLRCVSALPDDEQAYINHHKAEASKRLIEIKAKNRDPSLPIASPPSSLTSSSLSSSSQKKNVPKRPQPKSKPSTASSDTKPSNNQVLKPPTIVEPFDTGFCLPERLTEIKIILRDIYEKYSPDKINKIDRLLAKYEFREEEFLKYVYTKYNITPPWVQAQLDYLAAQQLDHLNALSTESDKNTTKELNELRESSNESDIADMDRSSNGYHHHHHSNDGLKKGEEGTKDDSQNQDSGSNSNNNSTNIIGARDGRLDSITSYSVFSSNKRTNARSISPPAGKTRSSTQSSWKMAVEEEVQYRQEILSIHYPKNDDEWMLREMSILTQFTRIFPPEGSPSFTTMTGTGSKLFGLNHGNSNSIVTASAVGEDDMLENRDDDNDQDDDDNNNSTSNNISNVNVNSNVNLNTMTNNKQNISSSVIIQSGNLSPYKPANYEEILFQVFLQDKRQALRLRCPLPNRSKQDNDTQSLPPVEKSKGYLYNSMGSNVGKGVVGWKLPPTVNGADKKDGSTKAPTENQLVAAERLSKGLSVAEQQHKYLKNRSKPPPQRLINPSVVMDQRPYIPTINITNVAFVSNSVAPSLTTNNGINAYDHSTTIDSNTRQQEQWSSSSSSSGKVTYNPVGVSNGSNVNIPSTIRQQSFRYDGNNIGSNNSSNNNTNNTNNVNNVNNSNKRDLHQNQQNSVILPSSHRPNGSHEEINSGLTILASALNPSPKIIRSVLNEKDASMKQLFPGWF